MARKSSISVGDKISSREGVELRVTEYIDWRNVVVSDLDGNSRVVCSATLRKSQLMWLDKSGNFRALVRTEPSPSSEVIGKREGMLVAFPIGSVWDTAKSGKLEILEIRSSADATVKWLEDGSIESGVKLYNIKMKRIGRADGMTNKKRFKPNGNYVYVASVSGEVVYVGLGQGFRYMHCYSGKSANRELNRLYFSKAPMIVEVVKDGLTRDAASELERELIRTYQPRCNENMK